ncbi:unnamed protein product [Gadus morhua 'NCC']
MPDPQFLIQLLLLPPPETPSPHRTLHQPGMSNSGQYQSFYPHLGDGVQICLGDPEYTGPPNPASNLPVSSRQRESCLWAVLGSSVRPSSSPSPPPRHFQSPSPHCPSQPPLLPSALHAPPPAAHHPSQPGHQPLSLSAVTPALTPSPPLSPVSCSTLSPSPQTSAQQCHHSPPLVLSGAHPRSLPLPSLPSSSPQHPAAPSLLTHVTSPHRPNPVTIPSQPQSPLLSQPCHPSLAPARSPPYHQLTPHPSSSRHPLPLPTSS